MLGEEQRKLPRPEMQGREKGDEGIPSEVFKRIQEAESGKTGGRGA